MTLILGLGLVTTKCQWAGEGVLSIWPISGTVTYPSIGSIIAHERGAADDRITIGLGGRRRSRIRASILFIWTYPELPLLSWPRELLDQLVALEQVFVVFRQRHARMVERVIGRRTGTGGSAGVDYLDRIVLEFPQ